MPIKESLAGNEMLDLALAKYEHHKTAQSNKARLKRIYEEQKPVELNTEFCRILIASPYLDFGIEEVIKYLGKQEPGPEGQPPESIELLLKRLNNNRAVTIKTVEKLADRIEKEGNVELSNCINSYWKILEGTSKIEAKAFD